MDFNFYFGKGSKIVFNNSNTITCFCKNIFTNIITIPNNKITTFA